MDQQSSLDTRALVMAVGLGLVMFTGSALVRVNVGWRTESEGPAICNTVYPTPTRVVLETPTPTPTRLGTPRAPGV